MIINKKDAKPLNIQFTYSSIEEAIMCLHAMSNPEHHIDCRDWLQKKFCGLSRGLQEDILDIGNRYANWLFIYDVIAYLQNNASPGRLSYEDALDQMMKMDSFQFAYIFLGLPAFNYEHEVLEKWIESPETIDEESLGVQANFLSPEDVTEFLKDIDGMRNRICTVLMDYWKDFFEGEWPDISRYFESVVRREELAFQKSDYVTYISGIHEQLIVNNDLITFKKDPDYSVSLNKVDNLILSLSVFSAPHLMGNVVDNTLYITKNLSLHSVKLQKDIPESIQRVIFVLSDPTRMKIVKALWNSNVTTKELSEILELAPPTISLHLKVMKEADLVETNKLKKYVYYSLKKEVLYSIQNSIIEYFEY
ncbi:MAG: winged helix-turn-helix transcriptional regulator [Clostridiales bacterium]|nr:winged helix-turn-helix transcriptional regulator [Clostridiales bacterium]